MKKIFVFGAALAAIGMVLRWYRQKVQREIKAFVVVDTARKITFRQLRTLIIEIDGRFKVVRVDDFLRWSDDASRHIAAKQVAYLTGDYPGLKRILIICDDSTAERDGAVLFGSQIATAFGAAHPGRGMRVTTSSFVSVDKTAFGGNHATAY